MSIGYIHLALIVRVPWMLWGAEAPWRVVSRLLALRCLRLLAVWMFGWLVALQTLGQSFMQAVAGFDLGSRGVRS